EVRRNPPRQPAAHVNTKQPESVGPPLCVVGRDLRLPEAEERQRGEREVDDPDSRGLRPAFALRAILAITLPPARQPARRLALLGLRAFFLGIADPGRACL